MREPIGGAGVGGAGAGVASRCARDLAFSLSFDAASCAFLEADRCRFKEDLMSKYLSLAPYTN